MKRILFSILALLCSFSAFAENVKIEVKESTIQSGSKINLDIMLTNDIALQALTFYVTLPEGFEATTVLADDNKTLLPNITWAKSGTTQNKFENGGKDLSYGIVSTSLIFPASATPQKIASIEVTAPNEIGTFNAIVKNIGYCNTFITPVADVLGFDNENTFTSDLALQRAAVITPQGTDYQFAAVPTAAANGSTAFDLAVNVKNEGYISNLTFDIEYPSTMLTTKVGKIYDIALEKSRFDTEDAATVVCKAAGGTAAAFTNTAEDLVKPGEGKLMTIPVSLNGCDNGVYTIWFKNIKAKITDDAATFIKNVTIPDYAVSVFVGNSGAPKDAILYGKYTQDVIDNLEASADFMQLVKDIKTVDMTVIEKLKATEGAATHSWMTDKIVYAGEGSIYARYVSNQWGSICLPFDIYLGYQQSKTGDMSALDLYELSSASSDGIVLSKVTYSKTAPAAKDKPYFFKASKDALGIVVMGAEYILPNYTSTPEGNTVNGLTAKGTYAGTTLANGAGYYLSGNKFYSDDATINSFRSYIEGTISSSVKALSIYIEDETGLHDITNEFSEEEIYNIQGMKLNKTQKGINIIGGKKVLVK